jgi:GGDEF domain-containing protein/EAL domain-containing protein (putative c-di-GMP-specific phosphodiesterase class I)
MALIRKGMKKLASVLLALTADSPSSSAGENPNPPQTLGKTRNASTVMAGSIQLLGMAEFRQRLGARWSAVADIACRIAEQTIQRHISAEDAYQRHGDETFVLCFASPDKAHAEAKTKTISEEIATMLAQETPQMRLRVDHTVAEVEWADIDGGGAESIAELIALELRQVRERADAAARTWRNELLRTAGIRFSPIWDPERRIVSSYRAMLNEQTGTFAMQHLAGVSTPEELKSTLHELDCLVVGRTIKSLDRLLQAGGMAQIVVPVNFNSLTNRTARETYLNLCRSIPESYKRFLLFEVHGAARGTPVSRLVEIALALKPYCHGVLVEVSAIGSRLQELTSASLFGISVDAKSLSRNAGQATAALTRLVAAATALNLKVFVHGADTVGLLEAAQTAQAGYVDGRAVALPMGEPKTAFHWRPH